MRIAVLGGTRFIGPAIVRAARARGHRVGVLHRGRTPSALDVPEVRVDADDPSALATAVARMAPDVLVDTRAMTRAQAEAGALAAKIAAVPVVVLSSQDVYAQFGRLNGLPAPAPEPLVTEDSPLTIPFPFQELGGHDGGPSYDKKDVEDVYSGACREGATILRLPSVYGSGDPRRRFGAIVDAIDAGVRQLPCRGGATWRKTMAHVGDVAHATVLAAEQTSSGARVFNVGEPEAPTMRAWVLAIAAEMGADVELREAASGDELEGELEQLGTLPNDFVVDTSRIRAALGFREVMTARARVADLIAGLRASRRG